MSVFQKKDYPVKWIPVNDLDVVWAEAQRGLNRNKVQKIASDFDPDAFGTIVTTLPNGAGQHHVIDGQTRTEAVRLLWGAKERVPCIVLNVKEPAEAAEIWLKINQGRTKPQAVERFNVAVVAGREDEVEVNDLLHELGYTVGMGSEDGMISAVTACLAIYRTYGMPVLRDALVTISSTYGRNRHAVQNSIIRGYAELLARYGDEIDLKRLITKVKGRLGDPLLLIGSARSRHQVERTRVSRLVADILRAAYNVGLRSGKLAPFTD